MAFLDEEQRRRARFRNLFHSIVLVVGIGLITGVSSYLVFGTQGLVWSAVMIAVFSFFGPTVAPDAIMALFKARKIDPARDHQITPIVQALVRRAELGKQPTLYIIPSPTLNAFAIGNRENASIGITEGLLQQLNLRELAGVLAHEITHVRNNDIWVMSLADVLSRLTRVLSLVAIVLFFISIPAMWSGQSFPWAAILMLYFAPTLSSLLQLALSRAREYDADLGAATLTGDPAALASALNKLERYQGRMWEDMVMPGRRIPVPSVLRTHPPTANRVARLLELRKPTLPPLSIPQPESQMASFLPMPRRPRYHWSGFWY